MDFFTFLLYLLLHGYQHGGWMGLLFYVLAGVGGGILGACVILAVINLVGRELARLAAYALGATPGDFFGEDERADTSYPAETRCSRRILRVALATARRCGMQAPRVHITGDAISEYYAAYYPSLFFATPVIEVSRSSGEKLPIEVLTALIAHELGHHANRYTTPALKFYFFQLPGLSWRLLRHECAADAFAARHLGSAPIVALLEKTIAYLQGFTTEDSPVEFLEESRDELGKRLQCLRVLFVAG